MVRWYFTQYERLVIDSIQIRAFLLLDHCYACNTILLTRAFLHYRSKSNVQVTLRLLLTRLYRRYQRVYTVMKRVYTKAATVYQCILLT